MSQIAGIRRYVRLPRRPWLLVIGLIVLVVIGTLAYDAYMAMTMSNVPANLDMSTTRTSAQGLYRGTWISQAIPININEIHTWTLHLETPDGKPLDNAQVTVDGGMPEHGHGLPTQPQVTQYLGRGDYRVEGMKFQMTGWWVVNFHITANGKSDTLQFNLALN